MKYFNSEYIVRNAYQPYCIHIDLMHKINNNYISTIFNKNTICVPYRNSNREMGSSSSNNNNNNNNNNNKKKIKICLLKKQYKKINDANEVISANEVSSANEAKHREILPPKHKDISLSIDKENIGSQAHIGSRDIDIDYSLYLLDTMENGCLANRNLTYDRNATYNRNTDMNMHRGINLTLTLTLNITLKPLYVYK